MTPLPLPGSATDNIVTINIRNMNKDGYVDLTYKKMWASAETDGAATEDFIAVSVASDDNSPGAGIRLGWRGGRERGYWNDRN